MQNQQQIATSGFDVNATVEADKVVVDVEFKDMAMNVEQLKVVRDAIKDCFSEMVQHTSEDGGSIEVHSITDPHTVKLRLKLGGFSATPEEVGLMRLMTANFLSNVLQDAKAWS